MRIPLATDSRLTKRAVRLAAGRAVPLWTKGLAGTSVGVLSASRTIGGIHAIILSSTHYNLPGSRQQGAAIRLSPTCGYYGAVDYKSRLIIIEHNPPTHLVATMPRH